MANVSEKVVEIVMDQLGVEENQAVPSAHFVDDLGADSLDVTEIVMAFESEFDIEVPDEDQKDITTVQQAIDYIENKLA